MKHFQINNYSAKVSETGLENGKLPENDDLYSYFSVKDQVNEEWFNNNWKHCFDTINLSVYQDFATNGWKNRDRMACIKEFIKNAENRDF